MATTRWLNVGLALLGSSAFACSGGGQTGEESLPPKCVESDKQVGLFEQTSLGFSANEFAVESGRSFTSRARFFSRDEIVDVSVKLGAGSRATYVSSRGDPTACTDHLDVETAVDIDTTDGALAEQFTATLRVSLVDLWSFTKSFELQAVRGTYDASEYDLSTWKDPMLQLQARVEHATLLGSLSLIGADKTTTSAEQTTSLIAEWPTAAPP